MMRLGVTRVIGDQRIKIRSVLADVIPAEKLTTETSESPTID